MMAGRALAKMLARCTSVHKRCEQRWGNGRGNCAVPACVGMAVEGKAGSSESRQIECGDALAAERENHIRWKGLAIAQQNHPKRHALRTGRRRHRLK